MFKKRNGYLFIDQKVIFRWRQQKTVGLRPTPRLAPTDLGGSAPNAPAGDSSPGPIYWVGHISTNNTIWRKLKCHKK